MRKKPKLESCDKEQLRECLLPWQMIPGRNDGRTKDQKELYCLRLYLLTLADHDRVNFPVKISGSEAPDFYVSCDDTLFGLEVSEVTDSRDQRELSLATRQPHPWFLGQYGGQGQFIGSRHEDLWAEYVQQAVARKSEKKFKIRPTRLLLYSNSNAGWFIDADRAMILTDQVIKKFQPAVFSEISIIKGDALLFDIQGERKLLPVSGTS